MTGLAPADDRESAIERILAPVAYTAVIRGKNNSIWIALVEAYDLRQTPNSKLANISTRGFVDVDDNAMIGGFIVGTTSNYVVRGMGPSLAGASIANPLPDPTIELRDSNGVLLRRMTIGNRGQTPGRSRRSVWRRTIPRKARFSLTCPAAHLPRSCVGKTTPPAAWWKFTTCHSDRPKILAGRASRSWFGKRGACPTILVGPRRRSEGNRERRAKRI